MKRFKQFIHTTRDVFRIYWEIAPGLTLGVLITQILAQQQGIVTAYLTGIFIDRALTVITVSKDITQIVSITLLIGGSFLIFDVIGVLNNYFSSLLSSVDTFRIKLKQSDFMVNLGIPLMENPDLTNKSTRFNEIYNSMGQQLTLLVNLISSIISTLVFGYAVFSFSPVLVLAVLVLFAVKFLNNGRFISKIWKLNLEHTEERRNAFTSINYLGDPNSLKEVLLSDGTLLLRKKFVDYIEWFKDAYRKVRVRWAIFEHVQVFGDAIIFTAGIFLLVKRAIEGSMSIGSLSFYLRSLGNFSDQLSALSYRISNAIDSSTRLQDALELFELYKPEPDGERSLITNNKPPEIKIDNISFTYPNGDHNVIEDLSLNFKPGEKVAIVGENGAGKTTLVKLITRIYKPQAGRVMLNKMDVNTIKGESLYKKFGVLFQDFNSYGNLTVSENIQMGEISRKIDNDLINSSLIKADAMSFVEKYPKKLDQVLSERYKGGIRPSGGQWQKIAIARFFYRNAPILILDEPTASIDAISEAQIFNNIYKFMNGKTVIIISHRFSTVRNADRILVIDKGHIIEEGSHEELLAMDGKYARMYRLQAKGYV